ncbi:pancreatic secretory granule membrane major glycoprotein GP2-like isoform X1 [Rhopilema esculentum]|uniref:pancreatic secretory granule membrane major glycoprotein GP2-like isoform X1 n=1 Tax=Rhopilema esculentum TaxID=499914 RepID=UPI0031E04CF3
MFLRFYACITLGLSQLSYISATIHNGFFFTWLANNSDPSFYPINKTSDKVKVILKFRSRWSSLTNPCLNVPPPGLCSSSSALPLYFYFGSTEASPGNFYTKLFAQFQCPSYPHTKASLNGYNEIRLIIQRNFFYKIRYTGCCWNPALIKYPNSLVNVESLISFPLNRLGGLNSPVQLRYFPRFTILQNEIKTFHLPTYDPDDDVINCRWAYSYSEGGGVYNARIGALDHGNCSLTVNGASYQSGRYAVVVMLEDYKTNSLHTKYHSVSLQFSIDILSPTHEQESEVNCTLINKIYAPLGPMVARVLPPPAAPAMRPYSSIDGCKNYHNLSSHDRSVDHSDWSSYRCDMFLYGWYRFTGQSGTTLVSSCPAGWSKSSSSCGTFYKGWLKDQVAPSIEEGVVNRTVCFSTHGSCTCTLRREIKIRNCGGFLVYYFDAVPTCNARYCGKPDLGAKVYCSSNYMQIELDESRYNISKYLSVTLRSTSCKVSASSTKIIIGTKLNACDTIKKTVGSHFIYENQLVLRPKTFGIISRDPDVYITFSCVFATDTFISSSGHDLVKEVNATEPGFGQFQLNIDLHINSKFNLKHKKFPISVQLTDRLYFEVRSSASSDYMVLVSSCYSTPVKDASNEKKYFFIKERCPVNNKVQFHSGTRGQQRFSLPASALLESSPKAYVHCLIFLCFMTSTDSRCQSGCQGNNLKRTTRSVSEKTPIYRPSTVSNYYMVEVGAIEKERDQSKGHDATPKAEALMFLMLTIAWILLYAM